MLIIRNIILISLLIFISSCISKKPPPVEDKSPPSTSTKNYAVIKTYFATDRKLNKTSKPSETFSFERAKDGSLTYGNAFVTIPRDHRMGKLESPSILRLEFIEDPNKHVVLINNLILSKADFYSHLQETLNNSKKNAFIFVHGYNVTFEDAARRTAQIHYDLGFDGAPLFYSWPSQGSFPHYTIDEQNVEWTQGHLKVFLTDFLSRTSAENVYLIAHSMGNRALTRALSEVIATNAGSAKKIKEIILTAPDIDAEVFKFDIAPKLVAAGHPITLYASSRDKALELSKTVHGYFRAGDTSKGIIIHKGVESIDASDVDTSFIGHSYFAEGSTVISDMICMIHNGDRPDNRKGLLKVKTNAGNYWKILKEQNPECSAID